MDEIAVKQHKNFPIDSNCYLVIKARTGSCVIVDPAVKDDQQFSSHLFTNNLTPDYIILTHEHFDHISSVEYLRSKFNCKVIASKECSERIINSKKNLSIFRDQVGFVCETADIVMEHNTSSFDWEGTNLVFYLTPGHSEGGMCFSIANNLFAGDTLMEAYKPVVKLPGGDKKKLKESIEMLLSVFDDSTIVYPGHGEPFLLAKTNAFSIIV